MTWSLKWGCEKPTEGFPALGFCAYNVSMKLYNFEKYYLRLAQHRMFAFLAKIVSFFEKVWSYSIGRVFLTIVFYITCLSIVGIILVYFFLGFNSFLDKIHLGQYKIMEFPLMQTKVDLRQFYSK